MQFKFLAVALATQAHLAQAAYNDILSRFITLNNALLGVNHTLVNYPDSFTGNPEAIYVVTSFYPDQIQVNDGLQRVYNELNASSVLSTTDSLRLCRYIRSPLATSTSLLVNGLLSIRNKVSPGSLFDVVNGTLPQQNVGFNQLYLITRLRTTDTSSECSIANTLNSIVDNYRRVRLAYGFRN